MSELQEKEKVVKMCEDLFNAMDVGDVSLKYDANCGIVVATINSRTTININVSGDSPRAMVFDIMRNMKDYCL